MQCKCGSIMMDREETIAGVLINYMHCKQCTRNHVREPEFKKLQQALRDEERKRSSDSKTSPSL